MKILLVLFIDAPPLFAFASRRHTVVTKVLLCAARMGGPTFQGVSGCLGAHVHLGLL
jgi:hypothetical protein